MPRKKTTKQKEKKKKITAKKKSVTKRTKKTKEVKKTRKTEKIKGIKKIKETKKSPRYFKGIGRRKTSTSQVRLFTQGKKEFLINNKPLDLYFPTLYLQDKIKAPLVKMNCENKFRIIAKVKGGGSTGQAEAIQLGLARALVLFNTDFRKRLRKTDFLTRDPRMRERKKPGLKRARRAPQWQKR